MELSRRDFIRYSGAAAATLLGLSLLGCSQKKTGKGEIEKTFYKETVVMGYGKDHNLKGGKWGIGFFPKVNTLEHLVEYDLKDDKCLPMLAKSWEIEKEGKEITFVLNKGIKFSDGSELRSDAVKFTVLWLASNHPLGKETFEAADVVDDYTVTIRYQNAGFFNLAKMAEFHMAIMSPKSVKPEGDANGKWVFPIGTGPLKAVDYREGEYAIYEPNPYWYGRYDLEPKFKKLVVKFVKDEDTRVMALRSGEVDCISDFVHGGSDYTPRNQLAILRQDGYKVFKRNEPLTWIIAFNYNKEPFSDVKLRKAVDLAIDRSEVTKIFNDEVLPAYTLFPESAPGVKEAKKQGVVYECNVDEAKRLVEEAGLSREVRLIVDKSQGDQILVSQLIQRRLKKVGFDVALDVLEGGAYKERRDSGEYDMRLYYIGGTDRRFYMRLYWRFHPDQKWKAYVSERSGDLCKRILGEFDEERRKRLLTEFYKVIYEERGVVPLYFDIMTIVASPKTELKEGEVFRWPNGYEVGEPLFYGVGVRA
ncbi:ABC transporter substrate-binding protein [Archaeoglobus neptunius]|uniref:ABC transporter substrate-binding protein n=1 Tax=Archaeoglobus neptunius TaxID=2798580 RepID=UPI0019277FB5|nr:ABC transporter substrate-binding protein [Archaeoglobus neptunius]